MKSIRLFALAVLFVFNGLYFVAHAQVVNPAMPDTTTGEKVKDLSIGAYLDLYAGWFSAKGHKNELPYFVSMNRNRELNVNLALLDFRYAKDRFRARLMPGFGTYMDANYAGENGSLAYLVEANVGYLISPKKKIWMDAGVLSSPYSNESCISRDHLMYSRSLAPEFVPYYLSGAKLSMPLSGKINLSLYLLNGWQQIRDKNESLAFGSQLEWRPNSINLINWNTFIGDERRGISGMKGENQRMRWFSDLYWIFNPDGKISSTVCVYGGIQDYAETWAIRRAIWWQANACVRYRFSEKHSLSARMEYFHDPKNAMIDLIPEMPGTGFRTGSAGLCWNMKLSANALFRIEGRQFFSRGNIFSEDNGAQSRQASWLISGATIWF